MVTWERASDHILFALTQHIKLTAMRSVSTPSRAAPFAVARRVGVECGEKAQEVIPCQDIRQESVTWNWFR